MLKSYSQSMFVNGDLLHAIVALDAHFVTSSEVLYDDVRHILPVRVSLAVQPMYRAERYLVAPQGAVLTTHRL